MLSASSPGGGDGGGGVPSGKEGRGEALYYMPIYECNVNVEKRPGTAEAV